MNQISKLDNGTGITNPGSYMTDAFVHQLGRGETRFSTSNTDAATQLPLRTYRFYDIFPTAVSEIALGYDTENTIEEFTVEFQVQYFEVAGGPGALN